MESAYLDLASAHPIDRFLLAPLAGSRMGRFAGPVMEIVHLLSVSLVLVLVLIVVGRVLAAGEVSALDNWLRVDALGAIFVVIVGLVGFLAGLYSIGYTRHDLETGELDARRLTSLLRLSFISSFSPCC